MDKNDMDLIRRMNEYIKEKEIERAANIRKIEWTEKDSKRVQKLLEEIDVKKTPFERDMADRYGKIEPYKYIKNDTKTTPTEWETTMTVNGNITKTDDSIDCDYYRPLNILYAQLIALQSEIVMEIKKRGVGINEDEWRKISEMLVDAYNFAAKGTYYHIDMRTLP